MTLRLSRLMNLKPFMIGMIHVRALPGAPAYCPKSMPFDKICELASQEARVLVQHGIDGLLIENMHDVPYMVGQNVGPEIVAHMATVSTIIRREVPKDKPIGIQILAGANRQAIAVAAAAGLDFVRVEGFVFAHVADEGFIASCAGDLLRYRKAIGADHVAIFADIKKKHSSHAITSDLSHATVAEAAKFCKADGIIITGSATGHAPSPALIREVRLSNAKYPIIVGSGVDEKNVREFCRAGVSGLIVGSTFKKDGKWENELDPERIKLMVKRVKQIREFSS